MRIFSKTAANLLRLVEEFRARGCEQPDCPSAERPWWNFSFNQHKIQIHHKMVCAAHCLEQALQQRYTELCSENVIAISSQHRVPLGLLMLSRGQISTEQLQTALVAQQSGRPQRFGECLQSLGFASEAQVTAALAKQWARPIYAGPITAQAKTAELLPHHLLEHYRMYPIQFVEATRTLYMAFSSGIDYGVLRAIEQTLDCRAEAILISSRHVDQLLRSSWGGIRERDLLFESRNDPSQMARITVEYALKSKIKEIRVVGCGEHIWARLESIWNSMNLLFRRSSIKLGCESRDVSVNSSV